MKGNTPHPSAVIDAKDLKRYQGKSIPTLLKLATLHFNHFIRLRDKEGEYFTCISCGNVKPMDMCNAGHYLSAGHHSCVRFDEKNCHSQCIACNLYLSGNLLEYRKRLERKIGPDELEALELRSKMRGHKWDRTSLIHLILTYKAKAKALL